MGREWKPGDVAMVNDTTRPDAPWDAATCTAAAIPGKREAEWMLHRSGARVWGSVSEARPLVVIDPEDREQVERLRGLLMDSLSLAVDNVQAALREFANPTPAEPTDPKARVEDRRENTWRLLADGDWVCVYGPDHGEYLDWTRLAAERGPLSIEVTA